MIGERCFDFDFRTESEALTRDITTRYNREPIIGFGVGVPSKEYIFTLSTLALSASEEAYMHSRVFSKAIAFVFSAMRCVALRVERGSRDSLTCFGTQKSFEKVFHRCC